MIEKVETRERKEETCFFLLQAKNLNIPLSLYTNKEIILFNGIKEKKLVETMEKVVLCRLCIFLMFFSSFFLCFVFFNLNIIFHRLVRLFVETSVSVTKRLNG